MNSKKNSGSHVLLVFFFLVFLISGITYQAKAADQIKWSPEEISFMAEHPEIRLGVDPTFVPYEFFDTDGVYKGIAADYVALISKATGLKMTVAEGLTWAQAYDKAVNRELDVLPSVSKTATRERYFLFSRGYYTFQRVIFINDHNKQIKSFDDLTGMRVAVQMNSSHHSYLMDYPGISLGLYPTAEEALQAVSDGREAAFVGTLSTSSYLIKQYGISNLRYITIYSEQPQQLYFAVRSDWPVLIGIINKALDSISQEDIIAINNKWISVQSTADYSVIIQILLVIGGLVALILGVSFYWINRLKKEIVTRKEAQEEMNAAKIEAEQANEVKSLFLARMSHEIRTPLSAITGMAYLIKKAGLTETQTNYLEKSNQAVHNVLAIINDILDFSKIESGKVEIEKISFDLEKLLQRIANIVSVKVEEKELEFFIHKEPGMPLLYLGDPVRIEQILVNLVNNAVKFTSKGSVTLSVKSTDGGEPKQVVSFCVQDTGIGMDEEHLHRLFTPFDQGDSSISRRFGGTGLGLSIVKSLTEIMGGNVRVQSEEGKGSAFTVELPLEADLSQVQVEIKKMAADCFKGVRALVLDSGDTSRSVLGESLKAFGIDHILTADESEAVQIMRKAVLAGEKPYNLLIVDYMTPQDGGIAFFEKVRKAMYFQQSNKCMLIVPMTREDLLESSAAHGIDYGLTKPVIPSTLYHGIVDLFMVNLPKSEETEISAESLTSPCPYHILLVEDNMTNQLIAQSILEGAGFRISKTDDGKAGYEFFERHRDEIDLILMDIHMPVMDGYTASDMIRKLDLDVPIIAMTADAILGVEEKCKSHGIYHYVSKPFDPEIFIHTLLDILKGKPCRGSGLDKTKECMEPEGNAAARSHQADHDEPAASVHLTADALRVVSQPDDEPVLDSARAIRQLGIGEDIYAAILQEYLEENIQTDETLRGQIDAGDIIGAVQTVHKVKSSSGSIGAKKLFQCAERLQKALQANAAEQISEEHAQFQTLLTKTIQEIKDKLAA